MSNYFADTFYYLALINPHDATHDRAVALSQELRGGQVTTAWVLTELADALAASQRASFLALLKRLREQPHVTIVPAGQELFQQGVDLYERRPDKTWTLTDCISFVVMEERGIREALTGDHHFEQAGFVALLG